MLFSLLLKILTSIKIFERFDLMTSNYSQQIDIKIIAWKYIDLCGHCGSCCGAKRKTNLGKDFDGVCGCTFRVDNPNMNKLPFLKRIFEQCMEIF